LPSSPACTGRLVFAERQLTERNEMRRRQEGTAVEDIAIDRTWNSRHRNDFRPACVGIESSSGGSFLPSLAQLCFLPFTMAKTGPWKLVLAHGTGSTGSRALTVTVVVSTVGATRM